MNFLGTKQMETERLLLRKFKKEDFNSVFENYASNPEVSKYMTWKFHKFPEETKKYLEMVVGKYENPKFFDWCIELKETGECIGSISAKNLDENTKRIEVGYCIGEKWWGKGFMPEALKRIIKFLLEEISLNRVEAFHDVRNIASGKVMQKVGMHFEGILREREMYSYGVFDSYIYSILKKDLNF